MLIMLFGYLSLSIAYCQYLSFSTGVQSTAEENSLPQRYLSAENNEYFEIAYQFTGAKVSNINIDIETYQYLTIDGFSKLQTVGLPALPSNNDIIALPDNSSVSIELTNSHFKEFNGYNIHPALMPASDTEGAPEPEFEINKTVYNTDAFFPENPVEIAYTYKVRGIEVAVIRVCPVQFNPVSGTIRVFTDLSYRAHYNSPTNSFDNIGNNNSLHFTNIFKNTVLNSKNIPDGKSTELNTENGAKNYIIVSHPEYESQVNQLAEWKRQLGYSVEVISISGLSSTQIKSEIQSRYDNWDPKPDFVLLFGDHDGPFAIPGKICIDPFYGESFATDLYYVCMDGVDDWHPDMAHGRISVTNTDEAQVVVDKIINYEKSPVVNSAFYTNGLSCAQYQDDNNDGFADRRFCHTAEEIRDYLQNQQGYSAQRIYYSSTTASVSGLRYNNGYYSSGQLLPAEIRSGSFSWNGGSTEITSSINSGKFFVFHRDHGYVGGSGWAHPYYTTSTLTNLNNGNLLPVVFSINCHTGEYQQANCFAEKFLRMENKGAVGIVAAAYYSFSGYNDALSIGMIDAIWPDPGLAAQFGSGGSGSNYQIGPGNEVFTMGDVINQGLYAMEMNWGGTSTNDKYQYELFHWFGDPAMKIWTQNPNSNAITATHGNDIDCSETQFLLANSSPGAIATLVLNGDLIGYTVIDESGIGHLTYSITEPGGSVWLTVSKTNHRPYVAQINVTGTCNFPPAVLTQPASLISINSAICGGLITDDYGNPVTESGIVFSTSTDPEIGGTNTVEIQTNPLVSLGLFNLDVSNLDAATTYYFKAFAINATGISYGDQFSFTTLEIGTSIPYAQTFENGGNWPIDWNTDNSSVWSFSTIWRGQNPPGGYNIYSDYSPSETGTVYSPVFNGSHKININVKFFHYWRANYSSGSQDGYFYGSRDGGNTFPFLIDEWHHMDPAEEEGEKTYDISSWADGYENISFKWEVTHSNDWYWQFDNFEIFENPIPGYWLGSGSADWSDPSNWHAGILPDINTDVILINTESGGFFPEQNSGNGAVCNNLTIEAGAHLYIPSGNSLTVNGTLVNHSGSSGLILKSDNTAAAASIIHTTPNVEAGVERYLSQMQWHFIGIPVKNALAGVFFLPGQSDIYLNAYDQSTNTWGAWIVPVTTPLTLGRGYEVWVDNNINQNETILFEGELNTGDMTTGEDGFFNLEYTPGFGLNLISNPYPSAIEADIDTWTKKSISNTVWTWDHNEGNYLFWNSTNTNNSNGYGTLPNGIIPSAQGFFVLATGANPMMTIPQRSRVNSNEGFYKNSKDILNTLKLDVEGNGYSDAIFVSFNAEANNGYENDYDVSKLYGLPEAPQLYSVVDGYPCSINTLAPINIQKTVQLGFECAVEEVFTFEADGLESFDGGTPIFLEDTKEDHIINLYTTNTYSFLHKPANDPHRFLLHFGDPNGTKDIFSSPFLIYSFEKNVYVQLNTPTNYSVQIYDMMGKEIFQKILFGNGLNKLRILEDTGFYLVKLSTENETYVEKVFIE